MLIYPRPSLSLFIFLIFFGCLEHVLLLLFDLTHVLALEKFGLFSLVFFLDSLVAMEANLFLFE